MTPEEKRFYIQSILDECSKDPNLESKVFYLVLQQWLQDMILPLSLEDLGTVISYVEKGWEDGHINLQSLDLWKKSH